MEATGSSSLDHYNENRLLQNFRELSASAPEKGSKSMVQMNRDGNAVISTRRNSALAKIIAHVFTKLSSKDFFD